MTSNTFFTDVESEQSDERQFISIKNIFPITSYAAD